MNNMEKVAEILGVKLGERFKINGYDYYIGEEGLVDDIGVLRPIIFIDLLSGEIAIEKLPWKPQYGDRYWWSIAGVSVCHERWSGSSMDLMMYSAGNCFKSKEEAAAHAPEIIGKLRRKYKEE